MIDRFATQGPEEDPFLPFGYQGNDDHKDLISFGAWAKHEILRYGVSGYHHLDGQVTKSEPGSRQAVFKVSSQASQPSDSVSISL